MLLWISLCFFSTICCLEFKDNVPEEVIENINRTVSDYLQLFCPDVDDAVEWRHLEDKDEVLSTGQVLEFINLTATDKGKYVCMSNVTGEVIKTFNLTVFEPPYFIQRKKMQKQVKLAGNTFKVFCKAGGNPTPTIKWLKDGKEPERILGEIKQNKWSLVLEDLLISDKGNYTCILENALGSVNFTYVLVVVEIFISKPILTEKLVNTTATVGSNVTLTCKFTSDIGQVIYFIKFDNCIYSANYSGSYPWQEFEYTEVQNCYTQVEASSEIFEITNVTHAHEGWYACVAANSVGLTVSTAYLTVIDEEPDFNDLNTKHTTPQTTNELLTKEKDEYTKKFHNLESELENLRSQVKSLMEEHQKAIAEHTETVRSLKVQIETLSQCYRQQILDQEVRHNKEIVELQQALSEKQQYNR